MIKSNSAAVTFPWIWIPSTAYNHIKGHFWPRYNGCWFQNGSPKTLLIWCCLYTRHKNQGTQFGTDPFFQCPSVVFLHCHWSHKRLQSWKGTHLHNSVLTFKNFPAVFWGVFLCLYTFTMNLLRGLVSNREIKLELFSQYTCKYVRHSSYGEARKSLNNKRLSGCNNFFPSSVASVSDYLSLQNVF